MTNFHQQALDYLSDATSQPQIVAKVARLMESLQQKWQSIETAPKDGTTILLCENGYVTVGYYVPQYSDRRVFVRKAKDGDVYKTITDDNSYWSCISEIYTPTHWMPLPEPPTDTLASTEVKP